MIGFGESFFVPYAVFMKASAFQVGLLSSLPQALGALLQVFSNWLIRGLASRKRLVVSGGALQALMLLPIAFVFFFGELKIPYLILFACLYFGFGMIVGPAWNSWMGDLVVEDRRGAYFGRRSKITGATTFVSLLLAGWIMQQFGGSGAERQYNGFVIIFMIAFACRMGSVRYLLKKFEPPYAVLREAEFSFLGFLRQAIFRNYGRFVIYLGLMNFSVFVAAPFFTPYMLNDLKLDYLTFTIINASAVIAKVLTLPIWGRAADRFGARRVLGLTGYLMPIVPIVWLVSSNIYWLIAIQLFSGFIWAGFEIAAFSFIFDSTSPQKRATCVAYYNMINGTAVLSGAMIGSYLLHLNPGWFASAYIFVFLISGLFRFLVSFAILPRLREVRQVETIGYSRLFLKVVASMPTEGVLYELIPFWRKRDAEA